MGSWDGGWVSLRGLLPDIAIVHVEKCGLINTCYGQKMSGTGEGFSSSDGSILLTTDVVVLVYFARSVKFGFAASSTWMVLARRAHT
jgi:hypothetical protein